MDFLCEGWFSTPLKQAAGAAEEDDLPTKLMAVKVKNKINFQKKMHGNVEEPINKWIEDTAL